MNKFFLLLAFATSTLIAQEVCEAPEASIEDLNSIAKCVIEDVKKTDQRATRQISVRISAPKKRYLKKRTIEHKMATTGINNLNSAGISNTNHTTIISNTIPVALSVDALTKSLSAEEVRKASSFSDVDHLPSFSDCTATKSNNELSCFNKEMVMHIEKHFNYPTEAVINKTQGKVWIRFIINKEGTITNIKTLGPKGGKLLNDEAVRVISKLPEFKPSTKNGKKVAVKYGLPIHFSLDE